MTKKFIKVLCFSCICLLAAACGEKENVYFQSETSVAETQRSEAVPETDDTQMLAWQKVLRSPPSTPPSRAIW